MTNDTPFETGFIPPSTEPTETERQAAIRMTLRLAGDDTEGALTMLQALGLIAYRREAAA